MNKCLRCGKNCEKEYCFKCKPAKALSSHTKLKKSFCPKIVAKSTTSDTYDGKMRQFFLDIWKKKRHYSEISNTYLGDEPLSTFFHHILYKESYPELMYEEDNIILLLPDEHANSHTDKFRYEEINKRRELLLTKYNLK